MGGHRLQVGRGRFPGRSVLRGQGRPQAGSAARNARLSMVRDPLRILLFLLTVVTISRVHGFIGLSALRPALLLAVLTGAYAFLNPRTLNQTDLLRTWPARLMTALAVMACVSVPFGMSIGGSGAFILETYAKVLLYAFLLVVAIRHVRDLYTFVWAYVVSTGILVILAAVIVGVSKTRGLGMYDANDLGLVLLIGLPLALAIMQSTDDKRVKLFSAATVAGIGMVLALSMSRGGFLGIVAVGLGLLFLLKSVSVARRLAFVAIAAAALVVAAPAGYWQSMETILSPTEDYNWQTDYGRRQVWLRGIGYLAANPLTGIGIGNFPRAEGTVSDVAVNYVPGPGRIKWSAAHNSFLQAAAEMGIPGFILFSSLVFGGMVAMVRLRKRLPRGWARGDPQQRFLFYLALYMPVSLLAFAVTGSFVSFAYLDPVYILAAFMAGLYTAVSVRIREDGRVSASASGQRPPGWRVREPAERSLHRVRTSRSRRRPAGARRGRVPPAR
ncbi:MAG: O-antigen ligase family protein [Gemmatimonadota bacterium]